MNPTFKDLVGYHIGGGWGTEVVQPESESSGYVIRGTDIPHVAVGDVSTVPLRYHKQSNLASRMLQSGDIVFEVSGGSKGQPVGRSLLITDKVLSKFDEPVMCASFCKLIRLDPAQALPGYVFRALQAAYAAGRLDRFQVQSTGIINFKWKAFLEHFKIELPDPEAQRRIASIFDAFDNLIENNRRRVELLEEMARAIYREWFVKFRYPGHEDVPLVDSALGPIPEGWGVSTLLEMAEITMGHSPKSDFYNTDGIGKPFHQGVSDFGPHFPSTRRWCSIDGRSAKPGDILLSVRAPVGRINLADTDITIGRGISAIRAKDGRQALLLGHLREAFVDEDSMGNDGAIFKSLGKAELAALPIVVAPKKIADAANAALTDNLDILRVLTQTNRRLVTIREVLLPKLVTGQIDVATLNLDTLASTLSVDEGEVA